MALPSAWFYVELNGFAVAVLAVIFMNMRRRDGVYSIDQSIFLALVSNVALLIILDTLFRVLNGRPGPYARAASIATIVLYNIINPTACMIWRYYVDYYIYGSNERLRKLTWIVLPPVILNAGLSILSIFINFYHQYDVFNVYHRGRYVYVLLGISAYMILEATAFLTRNRKKISRSERVHLMLFAILPTIGSLVQVSIHGLDLIWIMATISVLIIFVNIQKGQLHTDYLTDLSNRRHLDYYLQTKVAGKHGRLVAGVMIDIDSFKTINDRYGHESGDQALKYTAKILKATFRKTDFVARYGGDEFVAVLEIKHPSELEATVQRLQENVARFNAQKSTPYEIQLSVGYACYDVKSVPEFLKKIDELMYAHKQHEVGDEAGKIGGKSVGGSGL